MQSKPTYQLKWVRPFLQLKKQTKPNQSKPNQTKKPKSNNPQKQKAKHAEQFWKSPIVEIQNQKVLSSYMIM